MASVTTSPIEIESVFSGGRRFLTVEGLPVRERPSDDTPLTAALRMASRIVRQEAGDEGERLALLTEGDDGQVTRFLVRGNGEFTELLDEGQPTPAEAPLEEPAGWRPQEGTARPTRKERKHRRGSHAVPVKKESGNVVSGLIIAGVGVVCAGALGFIYTQMDGEDVGRGQAAAQQPQADAVEGAPLGYNATPRWVSGPLSTTVPPEITLQGEVVAVESGENLVKRSVQEGALGWEHQLPAEARQVAVRTIDGARSAVVVTSEPRIVAYRVDSGKRIVDQKLPSQSQVNLGGVSPMIAKPGKTDRVSVIKGGKLADVQVPAGVTPLGVGTDGAVLMGSGKGWVRVQPGGTPAALKPWPSPTTATVTGAQPQIASFTPAGQVVAVWPIEGAGQPQVSVYTDRPGGVQFAFRTPLLGVKEGEKLSWTRSTDGSWGVIGQQMIDLGTGRVEPLGPATDLQLGVGRGCATIGAQRAVFGPEVPLGVMEANEKCPAAVLNQTAILIDDGQLKALPAKDPR